MPVIAHLIRKYLLPTETFISNQIKYRFDFEPIILCFQKRDNVDNNFNKIISVTEEERGINKIIDKFSYKFFRYISTKAHRILSNYVNKNNVELLHFHYLVDARFFMKIKEQTGLPSLVSVYGWDVSSFPKKYFGLGLLYLKPIFTKMDYFIAMSRDMKNDLLKLGCSEKKIIVHYHGIDTNRFINSERSYEDKEIITILVCGDLMIKKAQHLTLRALRLVETKKMSKKKFKVVFVGDGPMRSNLEKQVYEYGWVDKVNFFGHVNYSSEELIKAYKEADMFSMPSITTPDSRKEGIPGTIVEAMASGLPVISSYHAGIPEIIDHGLNGILIHEGDIDAMARNFTDLLESPTLRKYLGNNASQKAIAKLDIIQASHNLEAIYKKIISGRVPV